MHTQKMLSMLDQIPNELEWNPKNFNSGFKNAQDLINGLFDLSGKSHKELASMGLKARRIFDTMVITINAQAIEFNNTLAEKRYRAKHHNLFSNFLRELGMQCYKAYGYPGNKTAAEDMFRSLTSLDRIKNLMITCIGDCPDASLSEGLSLELNLYEKAFTNEFNQSRDYAFNNYLKILRDIKDITDQNLRNKVKESLLASTQTPNDIIDLIIQYTMMPKIPLFR